MLPFSSKRPSIRDVCVFARLGLRASAYISWCHKLSSGTGRNLLLLSLCLSVICLTGKKGRAKIIAWVCIWCMHVCACVSLCTRVQMCIPWHMFGGWRTTYRHGFFFHRVVPRDGTQVVNLGRKRVYLLSFHSPRLPIGHFSLCYLLPLKNLFPKPQLLGFLNKEDQTFALFLLYLRTFILTFETTV